MKQVIYVAFGREFIRAISDQMTVKEMEECMIDTHVAKRVFDTEAEKQAYIQGLNDLHDDNYSLLDPEEAEQYGVSIGDESDNGAKTTPVIEKRCKGCGCANVLQHSFAYWGFKEQAWKLSTSSLTGDYFCPDCDGEAKVYDTVEGHKVNGATDPKTIQEAAEKLIQAINDNHTALWEDDLSGTIDCIILDEQSIGFGEDGKEKYEDFSGIQKAIADLQKFVS